MFLPFFSEFIIACNKFDRFYLQSGFSISVQGIVIDKNKAEIIKIARQAINEHTNQFRLSYYYSGFNQHPVEDFSYCSDISFILHLGKYSIRNKDEVLYEKLYSENLSEQEIKHIIKTLSKEHMNFIEQKIMKVENQ